MPAKPSREACRRGHLPSLCPRATLSLPSANSVPVVIDDPLKPARDAAFTKLGRNISLFQQLETGLKTYYRVSVMQGSTADDLAAFVAMRAATVATKPFGTVKQLVFAELGEQPESEHVSEPPMFRMRINFDDAFVAERDRTLSALIDERNRLVHHLHDDFDLRTADGLAALTARLDPQCERIFSELHVLKSMFTAINEGRSAVLDAIDSGEMDAVWDAMAFDSSPFVHGLMAIAEESAGDGGWTVLQAALSRLEDLAPGAKADFQARQRQNGLRAALTKGGRFEFRDEPTARGTRLMYRLIPLN